MKNMRGYITSIVMAYKTSTPFILLVVILIKLSGCADSQNNFNKGPESSNQAASSQSVWAAQNENSSDGEQFPLKIVIYTDFECGACERLNLNIEPKLREFKAAGIAQIDIRVLGAISDDSARGAQATLWADDSGRFLEYHDALFQAFRQNNENPCSREKLIDLAGSLGLNKKALRRCLDSDCKKPELAKNMDKARADGVQILPAVFINGVKIEGFKPLETYIDVIDRTLSEQSH